MIAILWFLFIASIISAALVWVLDHDGVVLKNWLGYEAKTDILTAILLSIILVLLIFILSYIVTRILAIRFPNFLKLFFRRNYLRRLEKLVHRHHQAFDLMAQSLLAIEVGDKKSAEVLQKRFSKLIKNPQLNNFFLGKIAFQNQNFPKAIEFFSKFDENKHARILLLKSKFRMALQKKDNASAIAYATQILSVKHDNLDIVKSLFSLYKKHGLHKDAEDLVQKYGDLD